MTSIVIPNQITEEVHSRTHFNIPNKPLYSFAYGALQVWLLLLLLIHLFSRKSGRNPRVPQLDCFAAVMLRRLQAKRALNEDEVTRCQVMGAVRTFTVPTNVSVTHHHHHHLASVQCQADTATQSPATRKKYTMQSQPSGIPDGNSSEFPGLWLS